MYHYPQLQIEDEMGFSFYKDKLKLGLNNFNDGLMGRLQYIILKDRYEFLVNQTNNL
jgi:hypothetical protein